MTNETTDKKNAGGAAGVERCRIGGADRDRTDDLLSAIQALSQTELQPHMFSKARLGTASVLSGFPAGARIIPELAEAGKPM